MKDKKIQVELTDDEFLKIAKLAHENDITFNHMCERILTEAMLNALHPKIETKQSIRRRADDSVFGCSRTVRKKACRQ